MMMTKLTRPLNRRALLLSAGAVSIAAACSARSPASPQAETFGAATDDAFAGSEWRDLTPADWEARLSKDAYYVLRDEGTERSFTSTLNDEKRDGTFHCAGCDLALFASETKYDSGTGWPSFYDVLDGAVATKPDNKLWVTRTEYHCARCLGHQGHVFKDGPAPTSLRYCNNGVALTFKAATA